MLRVSLSVTLFLLGLASIHAYTPSKQMQLLSIEEGNIECTQCVLHGHTYCYEENLNLQTGKELRSFCCQSDDICMNVIQKLQQTSSWKCTHKDLSLLQNLQQCPQSASSCGPQKNIYVDKAEDLVNILEIEKPLHSSCVYKINTNSEGLIEELANNSSKLVAYEKLNLTHPRLRGDDDIDFYDKPLSTVDGQDFRNAGNVTTQSVCQCQQIVNFTSYRFGLDCKCFNFTNVTAARASIAARCNCTTFYNATTNINSTLCQCPSSQNYKINPSLLPSQCYLSSNITANCTCQNTSRAGQLQCDCRDRYDLTITNRSLCNCTDVYDPITNTANQRCRCQIPLLRVGLTNQTCNCTAFYNSTLRINQLLCTSCRDLNTSVVTLNRTQNTTYCSCKTVKNGTTSYESCTCSVPFCIVDPSNFVKTQWLNETCRGCISFTDALGQQNLNCDNCTNIETGNVTLEKVQTKNNNCNCVTKTNSATKQSYQDCECRQLQVIRSYNCSCANVTTNATTKAFVTLCNCTDRYPFWELYNATVENSACRSCVTLTNPTTKLRQNWCNCSLPDFLFSPPPVTYRTSHSCQCLNLTNATTKAWYYACNCTNNSTMQQYRNVSVNNSQCSECFTYTNQTTRQFMSQCGCNLTATQQQQTIYIEPVKATPPVCTINETCSCLNVTNPTTKQTTLTCNCTETQTKRFYISKVMNLTACTCSKGSSSLVTCNCANIVNCPKIQNVTCTCQNTTVNNTLISNCNCTDNVTTSTFFVTNPYDGRSNCSASKKFTDSANKRDLTNQTCLVSYYNQSCACLNVLNATTKITSFVCNCTDFVRNSSTTQRVVNSTDCGCKSATNPTSKLTYQDCNCSLPSVYGLDPDQSTIMRNSRLIKNETCSCQNLTNTTTKQSYLNCNCIDQLDQYYSINQTRNNNDCKCAFSFNQTAGQTQLICNCSSIATLDNCSCVADNINKAKFNCSCLQNNRTYNSLFFPQQCTACVSMTNATTRATYQQCGCIQKPIQPNTTTNSLQQAVSNQTCNCQTKYNSTNTFTSLNCSCNQTVRTSAIRIATVCSCSNATNTTTKAPYLGCNCSITTQNTTADRTTTSQRTDTCNCYSQNATSYSCNCKIPIILSQARSMLSYQSTEYDYACQNTGEGNHILLSNSSTYKYQYLVGVLGYQKEYNDERHTLFNNNKLYQEVKI